MRILLAEDDTMIGEVVLDALRAEHYAVDWVKDGQMADTALTTADYDLLLLDLGLPRKDGLDAGADDYIVKPYDLDELLARIRALLRRADGRAEPAYEWGDVRIVPATREVSKAGAPVQLSAREWAVLEPLLARPGRVLSRQQLEEKLYSWRDDVSSNAVEVYIHGVRKKLGADLIQNVRGLGYLVPAQAPDGAGVAG